MLLNRFYLACFRDNVGENVSFHGIGGSGYQTDIRNARIYTKEEAQKSWESAREYDQPISAEHIDKLVCYKVDCQHISNESKIIDHEQQYVAFKKGSWNGNDVYWISLEGLTLNFNLAKIFSKKELKDFDSENYIIIPFKDANEKKRPTFSMSLLNRRTMIQAAGLKIPHRVKLQRRRKVNPKNRWNCPCCGQINWQLNPYNFEGCQNSSCDIS
jgi:hypothetical protein